MKNLFIILGLIAAILATVLSSTQFYNLSIAPIVVAFISGLIVLFISKKQKTKTKTLQYTFLLVIISLGLTIYKNVIETTELNNIEKTEQHNENNIENSKETLQNNTKD